MGSRRQGRILAFQALYSWEMNHQPRETLLSFDWLDEQQKEKFPQDAFMFARMIIMGTLEEIDTIDRAIDNQLENWDFSRLAKVDLAILRTSVYALLYLDDIPSSVTIDEAVDISKRYGSSDTYRFINGVLDGIRKHVLGKNGTA
jgi:N utilization substance protein B